MRFVDIHTHILPGLDDGAKDLEETYALIDAEYKNGVRMLCCTPHFHPGYYGDHHVKRDDAFLELKRYVEDNYLDMKIFIGNELHYYKGCLEAVRKRECLTINNTRYILVDFAYDESMNSIETALTSILREGYIPILAHIERYKCYHKQYKRINLLKDAGVVIQINAGSIVKNKHFWIIRYLLKKRLVDLVASDAHNMDTRPVEMLDAYKIILKKYGKGYADDIFKTNAYRIIESEY